MDRPSAIYESEKQLKALADVLEGKEYKNTGATRGQSKWLKYIAELTERNQVFGPKIIETEIMPEQTLTFVENEGVRIFEGSVTLNGNNIVLGEIYDVKIDDVLYKVECRDLNGVQILGNATFIVTGNPSYDDTGEPFVIRLNFDAGDIFGYATLSAGNHTISVSKTETIIKKIPKEYLPDDIGSGSSVQPDWNQDDDMADDYIKNRPFYDRKASARLLNGLFKFTSDNNLYIAKPTFEYDFIIGETYTVKFNGMTYRCNATKINDYWYALGNLSLINMGENTNEPFVIEKLSSGYSIKTNISKSNISVEVTGNAMIPTKIPERYLPDNIGSGSSVQPDWNQTDATASDYIKNKPTINVIGAKGTGLYSEIFNYPSNHMNKNTASGEASHAEGKGTKASGNYSHAEGMETNAEGYQSHSEGFKTTAKGDHSHAEGSLTSATKAAAHAEGMHTLASSSYQHTQGKYNIEDAAEKYAHIVGNGASETKRSNAHTLDWNGNAWYAGTVEGTAMIVKSSTEGSSKRFKITVDDSGAITATEITA